MDGADKKTLKFSEALRVLLMVGFLVGGLLLLRATPLGHKLSRDNMQKWIAQWGGWAWMVFLILGTVILSIGFPRIALAFLAGAMFGVVWGMVLAEVATTVSAVPPFYTIKFMGRKMVAERMGTRLRKFDQLLARHGMMVMLLIRLSPVGNAFVTNCLAGLSAIRFRTYITASAIGFLPMTFICALLGGGVIGNSHAQLWTSIGMLLALSVFFVWYFRTSTLARDVMEIIRGDDAQAQADA